MKTIQRLFVLLFALVILLPTLFFNFEREAISHIDNRMLTENPFDSFGVGFTDQAEDYINDRIGFRENMIYGYTMFNQKLFNKLTNPSYTMGEDGYIYGNEAVTQVEYGDYHIAFADMVKDIQTYCEMRDVPFLFVFNPSKSAVYPEYLSDALDHERNWVHSFLSALDERGVNYLDNTQTLLDKKQSGVDVFNRQYDANHWNDWGAYYGTNAILKALKQIMPGVHVNRLDELSVSKTVQTKLINSVYPINEKVPVILLETVYKNRTEAYKDELYLDPSYRAFGYYVNQQRVDQGGPRALVFQGSYMNGAGIKYMLNGLGEYIYVHDYENVIDFPYYFNIFQPDCVVFEVAEYTINQDYFDYTAMQQTEYYAPLSKEQEKGLDLFQKPLKETDLTVEQGNTLTTLTYTTDREAESAWLCLQQEYDMKKVEDGFAVTIPTQIYQQQNHMVSITMKIDDSLITYQ